MKRLAVFSLSLLITTYSFSQTIKVVKKNNRIKENSAVGFSLELDAKTDDIENYLAKFLKDYGKTRMANGYLSVSAPVFGDVTYTGNTLYATAEGDDKKCQVWVGLDTTEWTGRDVEKVLERVEKMTYQFGVKYYRDQAQKEIDLSQQALDATEKQKTRLINQSKDLSIILGNNEQEKLHLEKSLENNKLEHAVLLQKLENNKKSQDSISTAGLQIKKVLDGQKEKQKKIN